MAKPDLNDGYLRYAHELDAALACADFTLGARIVLREVFAQIFGPAKRRTAVVSPSETARRYGLEKSNLLRGVRELIESGVLRKIGECEYHFVKDYESWTRNGRRRLSESMVVAAREAPRMAMSYKHLSGVNPDTQHGVNRDTSDKRTLITGVNPDTVTVSIQTPNGVNRDTPPVVPPRPPTGERARKKETGDLPETPPPGASAPAGARTRETADELIAIAARRWGASSGDSVIGDLLHTYPPEWVRVAMDRAWDKHGAHLRPAYLRGILQRFDPSELLPSGTNGAATRRLTKLEANLARRAELKAQGYNPCADFEEPEHS